MLHQTDDADRKAAALNHLRNAYFGLGELEIGEMVEIPVTRWEGLEQAILNLIRENSGGRTSREILRETNQLARLFAAHMGYQVRDEYDFQASGHVKARLCWRLACTAQEILTCTDTEDVLAELEAEEEENE